MQIYEHCPMRRTVSFCAYACVCVFVCVCVFFRIKLESEMYEHKLSVLNVNEWHRSRTTVKSLCTFRGGCFNMGAGEACGASPSIVFRNKNRNYIPIHSCVRHFESKMQFFIPPHDARRCDGPDPKRVLQVLHGNDERSRCTVLNRTYRNLHGFSIA